MEEKLVILIYEKDTKLNQILKEQLSILDLYNIYTATDEETLIKLIETLTINILISNLNDISKNLKNFVEGYKFKNKPINILGYFNKGHAFINIEKISITVLEKPFKVTNLVKELETLLRTKSLHASNILLMNNLKFLPYEKVLINLNTKNKEHLTEKENNLLLYLCNNTNVEITKNDLLSTIWGFSKGINTHTVETHIYRLKQKLNKLEPNSSFLISNNNGLYSFQF